MISERTNFLWETKMKMTTMFRKLVGVAAVAALLSLFGVVSAQAQTSVTASLTSATCPGTGCVTLALGPAAVGAVNGFTVAISGTWAGTIGLKGSYDGATFYPISVSVGGLQVTNTTANVTWVSPAGPFAAVQAYFSTYTSGTAVVTVSTPTVATVSMTSMLLTSASPSVTSAGTAPAIGFANGPTSFTVNVGTGGSATTAVIGLPVAANGWNCWVTDITANAANTAGQQTVQTASTTTSCTVQHQTNSSGAALAFTASDILRITAFPY